MRRIADPRARQFWDPHHLVARALAATTRRPDAAPDCCIQNGIDWDEAALYPPQVRWNDQPAPLFWNGPVYAVAGRLDATLSAQQPPPAP